MSYLKGNKNQSAHFTVFKHAANLRAKMTLHELMVWDKIKNKQILNQHFRQQHPISTYVLDFFCVKCKLSVEIDGVSHYAMDQIEYDKNRTDYLNSLGIKEIRFTNQQIEDDLDGVMENIKFNVSILVNNGSFCPCPLNLKQILGNLKLGFSAFLEVFANSFDQEKRKSIAVRNISSS